MVTADSLVKMCLDERKDVLRNLILANTPFRERFVQEVSTQHGISATVVLHELEKIEAIQSGKLEEAVALLESEQKTIEKIGEAERNAQNEEWHKEMVLLPLAKAQIVQEYIEGGMTLAQAQAQEISQAQIDEAIHRMQGNFLITQAQEVVEPPKIGTEERTKYHIMLNEIVSVLKTQTKGITKTSLLQAIKRNSTHRQMRDEILNYLEVKGRVKKVGTRYFHNTNLNKALETTFHRKIYESLITGPKSVNAIVSEKDGEGNYVVGYNNSTGRKKVKDVLMLLWREGMVSRTSNGNWVISQ